MKKVLLYIFFCLQIIPIFSQEDCIGDSPLQPCCNDIISTDPYNGNAHNPERPDLINTFDWLVPDGIHFQAFFSATPNSIESPFNLGEPKYSLISNYPIIPDSTFDMYNHIMHPRFGWELIHYNMGLEKFSSEPIQTGQPISGPVLMFYNKYSGKLRMFASPTFFANPNQLYRFSTREFQSNLYTSGIFSHNSSKILALDNKTNVSSISMVTNTQNIKSWSFGDIQLTYDPCVCIYPTKIEIDPLNYEIGGILAENRLMNDIFNDLNSRLINNIHYMISAIGDVSFGNSYLDYGKLFFNNFTILENTYQLNPELVFALKASYYSNKYNDFSINNSLIQIKNNINVLPLSAQTDLLKTWENIDENLYHLPLAKCLNNAFGFLSFRSINGIPQIEFVESKNMLQTDFINVSESSSINSFEIITPGGKNSYFPNVRWTDYPLYNEATGLFAMLETPTIDYVAKRNTSNELQSQLMVSATEPIQYTLNPAAEIDVEKTKIYASLQFDLYQDPQYELEACCATDVEKAFFISDTRLPNNNYDNVVETFAPTFNILDAESNGKRTIHTALVPIDKLHEYVFKLEKNHISFLEPSSGKPLNMQLNIIADYTFLPNNYNEVNKTLQVYTYHVETNSLTPIGPAEYRCNYSTGGLCSKYDFVTISKGYEKDVYLDENVFSQDTTIVGRNVFIVGNLSTENNAQVNIYALEDIQIQQANISPEINFEIKNLLESESVNPVSAAVVKAFCNSDKYQARFAAVPTLPDENETNNNFPIEFSIFPNPTNSALFFDFSVKDDVTFSAQLFDVMGKKYNQFASNESLIKGFHKKQYNLSSLSKGVYFFRFCIDNSCKTEKVIVVR